MAMPQRAGGWEIANDRRRPDRPFQFPRLSRTDSTSDPLDSAACRAVFRNEFL